MFAIEKTAYFFNNWIGISSLGICSAAISRSFYFWLIIISIIALSVICIFLMILYSRKLSALRSKVKYGELRHQTVIRSLNDDIFEIDAANEQFLLYSVSKNMIPNEENKYTYRLDEVVESAHRSDKQKLSNLFSDMLTGMIDGCSMEYRVMKDGREKWGHIRARTVSYNHSGRPERILGVCSDIDKRKKIEEKLNKQQELYKLTMESLNDAVFDYDLSRDEITFSSQWYNMLGYKPFSLKETFDKWIDLIHPDDKDSFQKTFIESVNKGKLFNIEYRMLKADGEYRWLLTRGKVVEFDQDDTPSRVLGTCRDIHQQKIAEQELRTREESLRKSKSELQDLNARLINSNESQRRYLAREMHDEFTQRLAVAAIEINKLEKMLAENSSPAIIDKITAVKTDILELSEDIRKLSRHIHPSLLDDLGLVAAVRSEVSLVKEKRDLDIEVIDKGSFEDIDSNKALAVFRIVQEALRNVVRHSKAECVDVLLERKEASIEVSVEDDGIGFEIDLRKTKESLGLISMKERARLAGGELNINSKPGSGTVINLEIPVND
ncbi:Oxygen sensor histidine kinase NreB [Sedimentisphaera cyanobacteriorum]|uniref:Oxygen sensor histidine kinase NreB n=1 Tax=Sedimentisphaera cyanobacteriorum TaxID=1940790 RepID=A0A1Q2HLA5_9BACT|nr:PAS domain-containing protein [Sedimentisphaera cyanobacteriorum]AQQ08359.1 Oxygen sensor histidine kinase NreB [Sedimentisphaera cyanobacteriorum]